MIKLGTIELGENGRKLQFDYVYSEDPLTKEKKLLRSVADVLVEGVDYAV